LLFVCVGAALLACLYACSFYVLIVLLLTL